jgi:hypothetical protein
MITLEKAVYVFQAWVYKLDYSFVRGEGISTTSVRVSQLYDSLDEPLAMTRELSNLLTSVFQSNPSALQHILS